MTLQTQWVLVGKLEFTDLVWFTFFSTLSLYAVHRLTGLVKVEAFKDKGRYAVISRFKNHIIGYAVLSALLGAWFFFQLNIQLKFQMIIAGAVSLGYVLPVFGKGRRLRDFHYVKIFLIAITWAWVTVVMPVVDLGLDNNPGLWLLVIERAVFIFAITLPFDIRDFQIDAHTGVKTIPGYIGMNATKKLSIYSLVIAEVLAMINIGMVYSLREFAGVGFSFLLTAILIWKVDKIRHDYFYTGAVDGSMILQFLLVWIMGR